MEVVGSVGVCSVAVGDTATAGDCSGVDEVSPETFADDVGGSWG